MSAIEAVSCTQCGGAVQASPGQPLPACLFCGAPASDLVAFDPPEGLEPPEGVIPFAISAAQAQEAFGGFARSSFWHPRDLREARPELRRLLLPAWHFRARLEAHWAGIEHAPTQSGKRPRSGVSELRGEVLVPASATLTVAELSALGTFPGALAPFEPSTADDPFEVSETTRSAARAQAQRLLEDRHRARIASSEGLASVHVASLVHEIEGRPVLVPVYVGTYRYREHPYRVLVNGASGAFHGEAPFAWRKAVGLGLGAIFVLMVLLGLVAAVLG